MKQNELLFLVISVFVVSVIWIGLSIYHAQANSTITDTQTIQVEPINPHFNREIIGKLKARRVVDPLFDSVPAPAATQAATPTPILSPKALVTPAATPASASGSRIR